MRLLLLCLCWTICSAQDLQDVSLDRLRLELPATWTRQEDPENRFVKLYPTGKPAEAGLVIFASQPFGDARPEERFDAFVARLEQGRTPERALPRQLSHTRTGVPILAAGQTSFGPAGDRRVTMYLGVSAGSHLQMVVAIARSDSLFTSLASALVPCLEETALVFPDAAIEAGSFSEPTVEVPFVQPAWTWPQSWQLEKSQAANEARCVHRLELAGGAGHELVIQTDVQARIPSDTRAALQGWLLGKDFGVPPATGAELQTTWQADWQLPSGVLLSGLTLQELSEQGGWVTQRTGFLVLGPGWCFLVGAAVGANEAWWLLDDAQRLEVADAWKKSLVPQLWAVACSVRWNEPLAEMPELAKTLIEKGRYHYKYRGNFGGPSSFWVLDNDSTTWEFFADGTCRIDTDSYFGFSDHDYDNPYNPSELTGWTYGTIDEPAENIAARFTVLGRDAQYWILVEHPNGWTSLHSLELDKEGSFGASESFRGLAIDGVIEGSYYEGDGYKYRSRDE